MRLATDEATIRRGLPVVTPARAIVDLAEGSTAHEVGSAMDRALLLKLVTRREIEEAVSGAYGRHGLRILRPALARLSEHGETFLSKAERQMRDALLDRNLPRPQMNHSIRGLQGQQCRPDLLWPDARLIAEVDGPQHEMPYQQEQDRNRDEWLGAAGYRIIRFPIWQLDDHFDAVVERLVSELRPQTRGVNLLTPGGWA